MNLTGLAELGVVGLSVVLLIVLSFLHRRSPFKFRDIPVYSRLRRAIGLAVEDGTRVHFSLGRGSIVTPSAASALVALSALQRVGERTAVSDNPPVATAGDGALAILAQDSLSSAYDAAGALDLFEPDSARAAGLTPFSYAAATIPVLRDENISANVVLGNFGMEVGLVADAAERDGIFTIAASDQIPAQAVLFATTPDALIGEELYAAGSYLQSGPMHSASLALQDILRWGIVIVMVGGAVFKLLGAL